MTTKTVRVPVRTLKELKLESHYRSYRTVLPNSDATFVPGDGDVMSDVVFIGEAPGEQEDRLGKPFIGPSGNMLLKLLKSIGLSRKEVFITNLVKYRPPGNVDPDEKAASSARVLMQWELKILKPRVVVPLGRFATEVFYPNPRMSSLVHTSRKKSIDDDWYLVVPCYHPSAALRSVHKRDESFRIFSELADVLEGKGI